MGMDDVVSDDKLSWAEDSMTIEELKSIFGEEAVNRGLSYMMSLSEAEENYKESTDKERFRQRLSETADIDEDELDDEMLDRWASNSEDSGLGLNDE